MLNEETKKPRHLFLYEAENGGWSLHSDSGNPARLAQTLAAYSSSVDLIEGLADILDIDVTVWPSDQDVAEAECIRAAAAGMMGADPWPASEPAQDATSTAGAHRAQPRAAVRLASPADSDEIHIARTGSGNPPAIIPKGAMILEHRIEGNSATILYRT
ncbi:hypothetical protein [Cereibacter changlensis]|uniref:hypothetical protein n=1 Tax=Cereibacter changlensis TaxID=402884 RepID=UPI004033CDC5